MLNGGDEFMRSQQGNNNAYCHDDELSWFDWDQAAHEPGLIRFVSRLVAFSGRCTVVQRRRCAFRLNGDGEALPGITWYGTDLAPPRWTDPQARTVCLALDAATPSAELGLYRVLLMFHAGAELQPVRLPRAPEGTRWHRVADTSLPDGPDIADPGDEVVLEPDDEYLMNPRSTVVLLARAVSIWVV
jgi:glycogen operon protein